MPPVALWREYDDSPPPEQAPLMKPIQNRTMLALILCAHCAGARAAEETFTITPTNTIPSFEVNHMGFATQRGHFNQTSGRVVMDPQKQTGRVDISIDASSIDTGIRQLDDVLRELDFLNTGKYPTLDFRSSRFQFNKEKLVAVDGVLTMLGVSRPISLTVTHYKCEVDPASAKYICEVDAEASFRRSDHGMTKLIPVVSDEVKLRIKVNAARDQ